MAIDEAKLGAFVQQAFGDLGGALTAGLVSIGDKLGLGHPAPSNRSICFNTVRHPLM